MVGLFPPCCTRQSLRGRVQNWDAPQAIEFKPDFTDGSKANLDDEIHNLLSGYNLPNIFKAFDAIIKHICKNRHHSAIAYLNISINSHT
ncbi:hypothetical protein Cal6303_3993 [Calothrix sp. PCC 6303]|nr:hypothetical protein Cal6303_3993 [Calothrix sp. PCC 6303]